MQSQILRSEKFFSSRFEVEACGCAPNQFGACDSLPTCAILLHMKKPAKTKRWGDATSAIHAGQEQFRLAGPVGVSIARTANFTFKSTEEMKLWAEGKSSAYIYTRYGNPTLAIAEKKIARLEGAEAAVCTASGSAAISGA